MCVRHQPRAARHSFSFHLDVRGEHSPSDQSVQGTRRSLFHRNDEKIQRQIVGRDATARLRYWYAFVSFSLCLSIVDARSLQVIKPIVICVRRSTVNRLSSRVNRVQVGRTGQSRVSHRRSSSGKTESAKYVLQYLTESYGAQSGQIEDRINQCERRK